MIPLVDYHVHLDLYPDHAELIKRCAGEGTQIFTMTTTPLAWPRNREMARSVPGIRVGLGLHPQLVAEREGEIVLFEEYAREALFIGEVGLDASPRFYRSFEAQQRVFERILDVAVKTVPKILSIHSVRCAGKVLTAIEKRCRGEDGVRFVLHWFTGSRSEADRAVKLGCYFSINPKMLGTGNGRELVKSLPAERLLTETDGPFTTRTDGHPFKPSDVADLVLELASLMGQTDEATRSLIWKNVSHLELVTK